MTVHLDVMATPAGLGAAEAGGGGGGGRRAIVVFDVLRATTTLTAALAAGVSSIRIFPDLDSARAAAARAEPGRLLVGESRCLKPEGFDLGNSPGAFDPALHAGREVLMATTNGTRALVAAGRPALLLAGALVNASAVAEALRASGMREVTLLCAGTDGRPALEDLLGCGAVIEALGRLAEVELASDAARVAHRLFLASRADLRSALRDAQGGRNVLAARLAEDIDFAARLDALPVVGRVAHDPLRVERA